MNELLLMKLLIQHQQIDVIIFNIDQIIQKTMIKIIYQPIEIGFKNQL